MNWDNCLEKPAFRRWHEAAYWALLLVACVVMYVMNTLTPFKEDDMAYSLIAGGSLREIWQFQVDHFMTANGRFADVVATLFCAFLGKSVFNICNALMFGVMAHLVTLLATGRRSLMVLTLFLALVGVCFPVPGETMLWVAGSCNYLWAISASLALVWYLHHHSDDPMGWGRGLLLFIGAFIAGNFNEATSFGFFGGMFLFYAFNHRLVNKQVLVAMVGYLLGILLIIVSPGAWSRIALDEFVVDLAPADLLASRWFIFNEKMWRFYTPLTALAAGIGVLLWKGAGLLRRSPWTYILLCLALFMFAMGVINERAYSALVTVGFIITVTVAFALLSRLPWVRLAIAVAALLLSAYATAHVLKPMRAYKAFEAKVVSDIVKAPHEAILRERRFKGYSRFVAPLRFVSSETFLREDIYCAYYNKSNIQFVSDSVYERYHSGRLLDGAVEAPFGTDRPDIVSSVLLIPGQNYMVTVLKVDSLPYTHQQSYYFLKPARNALSKDEIEFRRNYGLSTDHIQYGFYPLHYQGQHLLIFQLPDRNTAKIEFPIDHKEPPTMVTLTPLQLTK